MDINKEIDKIFEAYENFAEDPIKSQLTADLAAKAKGVAGATVSGGPATGTQNTQKDAIKNMNPAKRQKAREIIKNLTTGPSGIIAAPVKDANLDHLEKNAPPPVPQNYIRAFNKRMGPALQNKTEKLRLAAEAFAELPEGQNDDEQITQALSKKLNMSAEDARKLIPSFSQAIIDIVS